MILQRAGKAISCCLDQNLGFSQSGMSMRTGSEDQAMEKEKTLSSLPDSDCYLCKVVREFIRLLEIEEESDGGKKFRPNGISTCRTMDGAKMAELLQEMKRLTESKQL